MFKIRIGAVLSIVTLFGIARVMQDGPPTLSMIYTGVLVTVALASVDRDHTYRVTPVGLGRTQHRWLFSTATHFSWDAFTDFSVTDDAIVLHRPFPHLNVRWSRADIIETEPAVVETLEEHLDRRT